MHGPPGRAELQTDLGKKSKTVCEIDFWLSQIEGLWIELYAHPSVET